METSSNGQGKGVSESYGSCCRGGGGRQTKRLDFGSRNGGGKEYGEMGRAREEERAGGRMIVGCDRNELE